MAIGQQVFVGNPDLLAHFADRFLLRRAGDLVLYGLVERHHQAAALTLDPLPGVDIARYGQELRQRFANPAISDGLPRLCRRGSSKMPHHLLPSLQEALAANRPHRLLTLAVAGWFRYLRGGVAAPNGLAAAEVTVEVHLANGKVVKAGDQFGIGRASKSL